MEATKVTLEQFLKDTERYIERIAQGESFLIVRGTEFLMVVVPIDRI